MSVSCFVRVLAVFVRDEFIREKGVGGGCFRMGYVYRMGLYIGIYICIYMYIYIYESSLSNRLNTAWTYT